MSCYPKWSFARTNAHGVVEEVREKVPISDLATVGIHLFPVDGLPLVETALTGRPWWRQGQLEAEGLVFVLRGRFPGAAFAWLGELSGGALWSALAGTALLRRPERPLCIDLVDVLYEGDAAIADGFDADRDLAAVVPWFTADESCYSYLRLEADGRVTEAAEKRVISPHASAGSYVFRDAATWLDAAAHSIRHRARLAHKGALFVCPSVMGLIEAGRAVTGVPVRHARPFSRLFHCC